jgi:hypothetical protein
MIAFQRWVPQGTDFFFDEVEIKFEGGAVVSPHGSINSVQAQSHVHIAIVRVSRPLG